MKIRDLQKRTSNGYTFQIAFGPFWVRGWWYNTDSHNVTPPSHYANGKRYGFVTGFGMHFKRLRDIVRRMVELGATSYNSDDMLFSNDPLRFATLQETQPVSDEDATYLPPESTEGE